MKTGSAPRRAATPRFSGRRIASGLRRLVAKLKPSWPAPRTDRKDPYALRAALLLVLSWRHLPPARSLGTDRSAFTPGAATATALLRLDAWVTPPVYTGIAPIVLADGSEPVGAGAETFRALSVPERSELIVARLRPQGESVSLVSQTEDGTEPKIDRAQDRPAARASSSSTSR